MSIRKILLISLLIFLGHSPASAPAASEKTDTITWLILDLPPFFITEGPDKGKGLADQIQGAVIEELDGYRHETRVANASRIARELEGDNPVCFAGEFYGNPDFLTSVPTIALFPHALIVRSEDIKRFGSDTPVSLNTLLRDKNLTLGTARDRLYGPQLDAVLRKHGKSENIYHRSGTDTLDGLLGMLTKGRVDYLIEYPVSARYAAKKAGISDRIVALPIKENSAAPPIRGAIRCPDTPWGRRMLEEINDILMKIRPRPEYRRIIEDWAVPPGREAAYWKVYEEKVLNVKE